MPRPEVVCVCECVCAHACVCVCVERGGEVGDGGRRGGVKPLVYRQWTLCHVTLVKWVKTTASIRTTHCRSFDQM